MTSLDSRTRRVIRDLAKTQHDLKRQVARLNRGQDAGRTTIHHGALEVADADGNIVQRVGQDGVESVGGVIPAQPAAPFVESNNSDVTVTTDGDDVHGETAPGDWYRTRVYLSQDEGFEPSAGTFKTSLWDAAGSAVISVHAGVWWVRIVWETRSGLLSVPSLPVAVEVEPPVDVQDIQQVVDDTEQKISDAVESRGNRYGTEPPEDDAPDGVIYYQRNQDDEVVAVFRRDDGEWVPMPLTDAVLVSLSTDKLVAGDALIGDTLIDEDGVHARNLYVTEEMVGNLMRLLHLVVDRIDVNSLWADQTWQNAGYFGAETANLRNRTDGRGMEVTAANLDDPDGERQTLMQVGGFGDNTWVTIDPDTGETLSAIGEDGAARVQMIDHATDPTVAGRRLVGGLLDHPAPQDTSGILDSIGWGEVAYYSRNDQDTGPYAAGEIGLLQTQFTALPGSQYDIRAKAGHIIRNGTTIRLNLRYTNNDLEPDVSSPMFHQAGFGRTGGLQALATIGRIKGHSNLENVQPQRVRVLRSVNSSSPWSFVAGGSEWRHMELAAHDVGPIRAPQGRSRSTRATSGGAIGGKKQWTTAWRASSMANYSHSRTQRRTGGTANLYIMQGFDPTAAQYGHQGSLTWYDGQAILGEVGTTMTAAMAGADLDSGTLDVYGAYKPGNVAQRARAYWHEYTSPPNSMVLIESHLIGEFHVPHGGRGTIRSEEHTSELQSRGHLVCRLLLEKQ